jgi:predicted nuclease with TOPRIM domain
MDVDLIRATLEIAIVAGSAIFGVKVGLNGMKRDVHQTRLDIREMKTGMKEASAERILLNTRLTVVEADVKHISDTVTRLEGFN